jgi:hypothetical protein
MMHVDPQEFIESVAKPLGWFYVLACVLNVFAAGCVWRRKRRPAWIAVWLVVAAVFGLLGIWALADRPVVLAEGFKAVADAVLGPVTFTLGTFAVLTICYLGRRFVVRPEVAWSAFNVSLLFLGLSMTDPEFAAIVTKPDNVPIVAMVYLLAFFLWLSAAQAVENDRRMASGSPPVEQQYSEKTLVWPDLVYIELICMILAMVVLIVWSLTLRAPLEQPANPVVTPNPSKAPWYFLGLQEMLVFSDPWNVGVVVPFLIIFGLMAIPYLDCNTEASGYYTIDRRRFAYKVFLFGFLMLWILLILIGTFMRGPNWSFFGLYEVRDPHKAAAPSNVKLSEYFWTIWLGRSLPEVAADAGALGQLGRILWREIAGVTFLAFYFLGLPPLLARTAFRQLRRRMGFCRYWVMALLLLMMITLPLKIVLRWTTDLSYIVSIPEWFFNF